MKFEASEKANKQTYIQTNKREKQERMEERINGTSSAVESGVNDVVVDGFFEEKPC